MPQTLHDAVQKALIAEEEMNSGGQGRTPSRQTGQVTPEHNNIRHQLDRLLGTVICPEDLCSRHHDDKNPQQRTPYRAPQQQATTTSSTTTTV
jgi:hypothetical protein